VRTFVAFYPPHAVSPPPPTDSPKDTDTRRTALFGARPLVRLTPATGTADDGVPPVLTFVDLEVLHARLVRRGAAARKEVGFVKWVCLAYAAALRARRARVLRGGDGGD
jgi:hypothetical protein